mgnify:CR=1 FL=1
MWAHTFNHHLGSFLAHCCFLSLSRREYPLSCESTFKTRSAVPGAADPEHGHFGTLDAQ